MLTVVAAGWVIAAAARMTVARALRWVDLPRSTERTRVAELLRKAELPPAHRLVASAVFWILFGVFVLSGLDGLGFQILQAFRDEVTLLLPRLAVSAVMLAVALVLANFAGRAVLLWTCNAGWRHCRVASGFTQMLLVGFTLVMILDHVGLARSVLLATFVIAFGAVMVTLAVALGVVGAPIVRHVLEERVADRTSPRNGPLVTHVMPADAPSDGKR